MKSCQIFLCSFVRGNGFNGRESKEAIGPDKIIRQFEPDDPKRMGGPVIIIEISICIDEGSLQNVSLTFLPSLSAQHSTMATQLYLAIGYFSRMFQNFLLKELKKLENFFAGRFFPDPFSRENFNSFLFVFAPQEQNQNRSELPR